MKEEDRKNNTYKFANRGNDWPSSRGCSQMVKQSKVKYEYVKGKGMNKNKNTRNRAEERSVKRDTSQTCKLVHVLH